MSTFAFSPLRDPMPWTGRFSRIPGKQPTLHVSAAGKIYAYWQPHGTDEWLTSFMTKSAGEAALARTLNAVKSRFAGNPGGSFLINEYGQVLCPIAGTRDRYCVGEVSGVPRFADPRAPGREFDLTAAVTMKPGVMWDRPYIGMKFNLDFQDRIRFEQSDDDIRQRIYLDRQDTSLVTRLRSVRGTGQTIRFIVNPHGVVLTKTEPDYRPVFVGHISPAHWFPKN